MCTVLSFFLFFFFYILRSEVHHPDEKSPVNSFISYKKIWLPSRITSQPFERDRPSDAVINLLDKISRKIFRVTCIPTRATRDSFRHTISGLDLKGATVAGKRIWDANRPEKRFNSMKSRHERVFSLFSSIFSPFNGSRPLEGTRSWRVLEKRTLERTRLSRTFNGNKMARRSADVSYYSLQVALFYAKKTSRMWSRNLDVSFRRVFFFIFSHFFFLLNEFKNRINYYELYNVLYDNSLT